MVTILYTVVARVLSIRQVVSRSRVTRGLHTVRDTHDTSMVVRGGPTSTVRSFPLSTIYETTYKEGGGG